MISDALFMPQLACACTWGTSAARIHDIRKNSYCQHRSHFGSRYTLGCCACAGLFRYGFPLFLIRLLKIRSNVKFENQIDFALSLTPPPPRRRTHPCCTRNLVTLPPTTRQNFREHAPWTLLAGSLVGGEEARGYRIDSCGVRTHALTEWRLEPPP